MIETITQEDTKQLIFKDKGSLNLKAKVGANIKIANASGNIEIQSWDKEELALEVTAVNNDSQEDIIIEYQQKDNSFGFKTQLPNETSFLRINFALKKINVNYLLSVPEKSIILINLVNGNIKLKDLDGIDVNNVNGNVTAENMTGLCSVKITNGSVNLKKIEGDKVTASNVNGTLNLESIDGEITANTVNGSIELADIKNNTHAKTVNGSIKATLSSKRKIDFKGKTLNGKIKFPTEKTEQSKRVKRISEIIGDINGEPLELNLATVNGKIEVEFQD